MQYQTGAASPSIVAAIALGLLVVLFGIFGVWSYTNYIDQKDNVDAKVRQAVTAAQTAQKAEDEEAFAEREKSPSNQFVGPEDLGQVAFNYPRTWSVYIGEDGSRGKFEAYFNPTAVVAPTRKLPYALRLTITDQAYETALKNYQAQVTKGELKASPITINTETGTRLDGTFSPTVKGSMVLLKLRDKTISIYTEAEDYLNDFNTTVIPSLKFNP